MKPLGHVVVSAGLGVSLGLATRSPTAGGVSLLVGVFMDLDHLPDYYRMFIQNRPNSNWLFLHGYELLAPMLLWGYLASWHPLPVAVAVAHLAHLLCDQFTNRMHPLYYFLSYRAWKRFRHDELGSWSPQGAYAGLLSLPLGRRLLPPLVRRLRGEKKGPGD
ncbi:MAG: hypothetical protein HY687_05200 [Chloroflexi bacterium]|nr:hypothetical protein [Chloroflexota bacterium]